MYLVKCGCGRREFYCLHHSLGFYFFLISASAFNLRHHVVLLSQPTAQPKFCRIFPPFGTFTECMYGLCVLSFTYLFRVRCLPPPTSFVSARLSSFYAGLLWVIFILILLSSVAYFGFGVVLLVTNVRIFVRMFASIFSLFCFF